MLLNGAVLEQNPVLGALRTSTFEGLDSPGVKPTSGAFCTFHQILGSRFLLLVRNSLLRTIAAELRSKGDCHPNGSLRWNVHRQPLDFIARIDDDRAVRYPGGKEKCFQHIVNLLPPHSVYIEPFLGAGAVLRNKRPADVNIGVDQDRQLIQNWRRDYSGLATFVEGDAVAFLSKQTFLGDEVIYCDPPYLPTTRLRARISV